MHAHVLMTKANEGNLHQEETVKQRLHCRLSKASLSVLKKTGPRPVSVEGDGMKNSEMQV